MDRLDCDRLFVAVMETGSFAAASARLKISSGQASKLLARLERELGVQLLKRTTRALAATEIGQAYFQRIRGIIADLDELDLAIHERTGEPTGKLKITAAETFGRAELSPLLPEFLALHPRLSIEVHFANRLVSIVDEGYDAALRIGRSSETSLIARKICERRVATVASAAYLARHGTPRHPSDLAGHVCIMDTNFPEPERWRYRTPGSGEPIVASVEGRLALSDPETCLIAAEQGFGIAHVPLFGAMHRLDTGALVPILCDYELPPVQVSLVYPPTRHLAPKVRALIDFLVARFSASKDG